MKIITHHVNPPIPFRGLDWEAVIDGREDTMRGTGKTELAALQDLLNQLEDEEAAMAEEARRDDEQHYIEHGPGRR
jgi:hypothetical protein